MACDLTNCRESLLLGVLAPFVICILFYIAIFGYSLYVTDRDHSVDIKHWQRQQLNGISSRYAGEMRQLNREIRQLEGG